jgi:hypothetical protein
MPTVRSSQAVVTWIEANQIRSQLAPHNELLEKSLAILARRVRIFHCQRHGVRADVTEVQIG